MSKGKTLKISEIAKMVDGELIGEPFTEIRGVSSLEFAGPDMLSFVGGAKFREDAQKSTAGALIVYEKLDVNIPQIVVPDAFSAFVKVMNIFHPDEPKKPGIHPTALIEDNVETGDDIHVGPHTVICKNSKIGSGSIIEANCSIGEGCEMGENCRIHPGVTMYPGVKTGKGVIIHSGTVIGSDGFGYILSPDGHLKKPQVGSVIIEDNVEIGANCTIDRAMLDNTLIGEGTKLDNMVHLAHNVRTGKHCIILAGAAIGGSTVIGDRTIISGNVTVKDNIKLGDDVTVVGHSAVIDDISSGDTVWGFPAIPFSKAKMVYIRLKKLPELFTRVRALEKAIKKDKK